LTGVVDVLSFDLNEIILETDQGMLMIKGSELHVNRLTLEKGEVDIDGKVDSFTYSEQAGMGGKGESLLSRLFK
jgi:sporulation protein YabP